MLANALYLIIVAATNFILPKFTSIGTYAAIKEYTLYLTTYSSIMTLGYIQGVYIKYGGREVEDVNPKHLGSSLISFVVFMLPISVIVTAAGVYFDNIVIGVLGIGLISVNLQNYFQFLYQATGDFKSYGVALNASRVILLIAYLVLIFVFKTDNKALFVSITPIVGVAVAVYLTIKLNMRIPILKGAKFSVKEVKRNIRTGFILMLGDFVTKFFSSVDRWFVKTLMKTFFFAMYSFACSLETLVNTFMTPVTVSMYNYFCKRPSVKEIRKMKDIALIYSFIIIAAAYPAKWVLEVFMNKYISSVVVIFPLFAAQGLGTVIKGIYVNKYKADGTQRKYLFQMIAMLTLAIVLNGAFYFVFRNMLSIAVATLITNIIWLIVCEVDAPSLRYDIKVILTITVLLGVYIYTGLALSSILGCAIYCSVGLLFALTTMRESFLYVVKSTLKSIKNKLGIAKK